MGEQTTTTSFKCSADWEPLYIEYGPILFNYGCKITKQKTLIEDCIHDVFVNLLKHPYSQKSIEHPKAYLFKSFRRLLMQKLKADASLLEVELNHDAYQFNIELSSETYHILEEHTEEQHTALAGAIQQLSPRQREAIYLKFYENHSYEEVACIMKIEKSALYSMIYKSLAHLRKVLSPSLTIKSSIGYPLSVLVSNLLLLLA